MRKQIIIIALLGTFILSSFCFNPLITGLTDENENRLENTLITSVNRSPETPEIKKPVEKSINLKTKSDPYFEELNGHTSAIWNFTSINNYTYSAFINATGSASIRENTTGIQAHYSFNNNSVGVNDVTDNLGNYHGTTVNMEDDDWVPSKIGLNNSLLFDGVDEYVDLGTEVGNFERTDPFTLECWFNTTDVQMDLAAKRNYVGALEGWAMTIAGTGDLILMLVNTVSGNNYIRVDADISPPSDGSYHHVVVSYNGNSLASGVDFIVDGVDVGEIVVRDTLDKTILNVHETRIGSRENNPYSYNGTIDEFIIYNRTVSVAEAQYRYNNSFGRENLFYNNISDNSAYINSSVNDNNIADYTNFTCNESISDGTNIKYVLSDDNGSTWYFLNSSGQWATSDGSIDQSNTSVEINENINNFTSVSKSLTWKALLTSNGTYTPILHSVNLTYNSGVNIAQVDITPEIQVKSRNITLTLEGSNVNTALVEIFDTNYTMIDKGAFYEYNYSILPDADLGSTNVSFYANDSYDNWVVDYHNFSVVDLNFTISYPSQISNNTAISIIVSSNYSVRSELQVYNLSLGYNDINTKDTVESNFVIESDVLYNETLPKIFSFNLTCFLNDTGYNKSISGSFELIDISVDFNLYSDDYIHNESISWQWNDKKLNITYSEAEVLKNDVNLTAALRNTTNDLITDYISMTNSGLNGIYYIDNFFTFNSSISQDFGFFTLIVNSTYIDHSHILTLHKETNITIDVEIGEEVIEINENSTIGINVSIFGRYNGSKIWLVENSTGSNATILIDSDVTVNTTYYHNITCVNYGIINVEVFVNNSGGFNKIYSASTTINVTTLEIYNISFLSELVVGSNQTVTFNTNFYANASIYCQPPGQPEYEAFCSSEFIQYHHFTNTLNDPGEWQIKIHARTQYDPVGVNTSVISFIVYDLNYSNINYETDINVSDTTSFSFESNTIVNTTLFYKLNTSIEWLSIENSTQDNTFNFTETFNIAGLWQFKFKSQVLSNHTTNSSIYYFVVLEIISIYEITAIMSENIYYRGETAICYLRVESNSVALSRSDMYKINYTVIDSTSRIIREDQYVLDSVNDILYSGSNFYVSFQVSSLSSYGIASVIIRFITVEYTDYENIINDYTDIEAISKNFSTSTTFQIETNPDIVPISSGKIDDVSIPDIETDFTHTISIDIKNTGSEIADYRLLIEVTDENGTLKYDGTTNDFSVVGGEIYTYSFDWVPEKPGTCYLSVNLILVGHSLSYGVEVYQQTIDIYSADFDIADFHLYTINVRRWEAIEPGWEQEIRIELMNTGNYTESYDVWVYVYDSNWSLIFDHYYRISNLIVDDTDISYIRFVLSHDLLPGDAIIRVKAKSLKSKRELTKDTAFEIESRETLIGSFTYFDLIFVLGIVVAGILAGLFKNKLALVILGIFVFGWTTTLTLLGTVFHVLPPFVLFMTFCVTFWAILIHKKYKKGTLIYTIGVAIAYLMIFVPIWAYTEYWQYWLIGFLTCFTIAINYYLRNIKLIIASGVGITLVLGIVIIWT